MTTHQIAVFMLFAASLACAVTSSAQQPTSPPPENAHVVNSFTFEIAAPMKQVAPLFAPEAERSWAGDNWNPVFAHPQPGRDIEGAVFTTKHGPVTTIWVNTIFNVDSGRMQYVAVVPDKFAMTVDVQVTALTATLTAVKVTYTRTALDPSANAHVIQLGDQDKSSAPNWQHSIESALGLSPKSNH
ncbi:MAG TPA: hypothetical protein VGJ06_15645 [Candidatus Acidoferrum sp.]|jgi:hypothetical protein